jgi:hypothetical protein
MSVHINLVQLENWTELDRSTQHHAGMCARMLTDGHEVTAWRPGCVNQTQQAYNADPVKTLEGYALDSLMCALTHAEPKYAFRALLQAKAYCARLREQGKHAGHPDTMRQAQSRVEKLLGLS